MNKIINIFEEHAEKIVFGVIGLVCLWLLFTRVIISPNKVEYGGEKISPGEIDIKIMREAEDLKQKLNEPPKQQQIYTSRLTGPIGPNDPVREGIRGNLRNGFVGLFDNPLSIIDAGFGPSIPPAITRDIRKDSIKYRIPVIGEVNNVAVEHIRAVAYVPIGVVGEQHPYDRQNSEVNDIDFVTVEAKFNATELYKNFQESFGSVGVQESQRDPCFAKPVFAAVQLQRQQLNDDGNWSEWQDVPRTKIDPYKKSFEIIEYVQDLPPGGLKVRMLQFDNSDVVMNLLQPQAYRIASANQQWFPPTIHRKFLGQQRQEELEARRQAKEQEQLEREKQREEKLGERRTSIRGTYPGDTTGLSGYGREGLYGGSRSTRESGTRRPYSTRTDRRSETDRTRLSDRTRLPDRGRITDSDRYTRTRTRDDLYTDTTRPPTDRDTLSKTTMDDIYNEFDSTLITPNTDLTKESNLAFWAHDDIVEPKKSYRYRIRIGVFNPIAGTNQFREQDKSHQNNVILWSEFSDATDVVEIPGRSYFFANDLQQAAKTVTVTVCKYVLGYWYSEKFPVRQGEAIGKVKPVQLKSQEEQIGVVVPQKIDYSTGAVFVDIMPVNDWAGGKKLSARGYYDMLYSFDGMNIEHTPIQSKYWNSQLQTLFYDIQTAQKQPRQPLRDWDSRMYERIQRIPQEGYRRGGYEEVMMRETTKRTDRL